MTNAIAPLEGIRILDIATFIAAPFAGTCLSEFGAEVIKIEKPGVGDYLRNLGTPSEVGDTYWWFNDARNKKSITLDLKQEDGKALFRKLVKDADVVLENFRPGTLEKWGLGFEALREINPRLVMLRVSAYGREGPKKTLPGFARIAQAYAGLSYITGTPETAPLIAGSTTLADYLSGLYGAYGILLALRSRDQTGQGQYVDVALHDGIFRFLDEIAAVYDKQGEVRERQGTETHGAVPHSHYPTGDDGWVAIACTNDKMFARLCKVMQRPDLAAEETFGLKAARLASRNEVNGIVADWTSSLARDEVIKRCADGDVPCGPICSIADIFKEEQYWVRDTILRVPDPRIGELAVQGLTIVEFSPQIDGTDVLKEGQFLGVDQITEDRGGGIEQDRGVQQQQSLDVIGRAPAFHRDKRQARPGAVPPFRAQELESLPPVQIGAHTRGGHEAVGGRQDHRVIALPLPYEFPVLVVIPQAFTHEKDLPIQHRGAAVVHPVADRPVAEDLFPVAGQVQTGQSGRLIIQVRLQDAAVGAFAYQTHPGELSRGDPRPQGATVTLGFPLPGVEGIGQAPFEVDLPGQGFTRSRPKAYAGFLKTESLGPAPGDFPVPPALEAVLGQGHDRADPPTDFVPLQITLDVQGVQVVRRLGRLDDVAPPATEQVPVDVAGQLVRGQ